MNTLQTLGTAVIGAFLVALILIRAKGINFRMIFHSIAHDREVRNIPTARIGLVAICLTLILAVAIAAMLNIATPSLASVAIGAMIVLFISLFGGAMGEGIVNWRQGIRTSPSSLSEEDKTELRDLLQKIRALNAALFPVVDTSKASLGNAPGFKPVFHRSNHAHASGWSLVTRSMGVLGVLGISVLLLVAAVDPTFLHRIYLYQ